MPFSRDDKFNSNRNFVEIKFGKEKALLETELNEMQKILTEKIKNSNKVIFSDGFIGIHRLTYENNVFKFLADYYIKDGIVLPLKTELMLYVESKGIDYNIYFENKEKVVSYIDEIPSDGNLNKNELISIEDILDSELDIVEETSRRIQSQYNLVLIPVGNDYVGDGELIANISSDGTLTRIVEEKENFFNSDLQDKFNDHTEGNTDKQHVIISEVEPENKTKGNVWFEVESEFE